MATLEHVKRQIEKSKIKGIWKNREDAQKALRKLGCVEKAVFKQLVTQTADGRWALNSAVEAQAAALSPAPSEPGELATVVTGGDPGLRTKSQDPSLAGAGAKPKAAKEKKAKAPGAKASGRVGTVAEVMRRLIRAGKTNKEVFEAAKAELPAWDSEGKESHAAWYRSKLRKEGEEV